MKLVVRARASAWLAGGMYVWGRPPPARNPAPLGLLHQRGSGVRGQGEFGLNSLCSCGGKVIDAKFWNLTSYAMPKPPRMEVVPRPKGSYAKPTRGPNLFLS